MKQNAELDAVRKCESPELRSRIEIDRINARLRHFRGVAASVMAEALTLWKEIWDEFRDPRTCEQILEGSGVPAAAAGHAARADLLEKLHILGIKIDYARRLCEGEPDGKPRLSAKD